MSGQIVGRIKQEEPIRAIMERIKAECQSTLDRLGRRSRA
jgi:hypothetical protein